MVCGLEGPELPGFEWEPTVGAKLKRGRDRVIEGVKIWERLGAQVARQVKTQTRCCRPHRTAAIRARGAVGLGS